MPKPRTGPPGPITLQCEAGQAVFTHLARRFFAQASQPTFLRLAQEATGDNTLHSSQIKGFSDGTLGYPAPKVFVALGALNALVATTPIRRKGPASQNIQPITLPDGTVLDACGLFAVFTGLLPVELPDQLVIPEAQAAELSASLGRYLRSQFGSQGIDFAVTDRQRLVQAAPVLRQLLAGEVATAHAITTDLEAIAELLGCPAEALWDVVAGLLAQITG
jgi:hypothetical protein